jgi:hypothetical protein
LYFYVFSSSYSIEKTFHFFFIFWSKFFLSSYNFSFTIKKIYLILTFYEYLGISIDTSKSINYPLSRYPHVYRADTNIIFIQRDKHEYHVICLHRYPFTFLILSQKSNVFKLIKQDFWSWSPLPQYMFNQYLLPIIPHMCQHLWILFVLTLWLRSRGSTIRCLRIIFTKIWTLFCQTIYPRIIQASLTQQKCNFF